MSEKDIIDLYAKELKLASLRGNVSLFAEDAIREQWGYLAFLRRLLEEEVTRRREKSKITRIHRADFPQMKYLVSAELIPSHHDRGADIAPTCDYLHY